MMQIVEFPFMSASLVVLFFGGLLIYMNRDRFETYVGKVATGFSLVSLILMLPPFYRVMYERGVALESMQWSSVLGSFGLFLDGIAFPITFAVVFLGFLSVIYAIGYTRHMENRSSFFANQLFFLMGMQWVTLATNIIEFFIAWELMLVPSYFLILFWGLPETKERTALKFWLYTQAGAVCIIVGLGLIYMATGHFVIQDIQTFLASGSPAVGQLIASGMLKAIFILLAAGFLVKMAVFPIHWWLPPVHAEAPTPISVLLSGAMIETGAYALMRFGNIMLFSAARDLAFFVSALGVVTMFYGGFMALAQVDIKRLLAYSSVSQMGYVLFALGSFSTFGATGGLFHLINHAFSKGLLFMTAGTVIHQTGKRDITQMGGLSNKMPVTAFLAAVGAMSIAGSPPLSGFSSEWLMFLGGFQVYFATGSTSFLILTILAVSSSILSAGYMLRFIWKVFLGPNPEDLEQVTDGPRSMLIPQVLLGVLIVLFGIFPGIAVDIILPAVQHLADIIPTP